MSCRKCIPCSLPNFHLVKYLWNSTTDAVGFVGVVNTTAYVVFRGTNGKFTVVRSCSDAPPCGVL